MCAPAQVCKMNSPLSLIGALAPAAVVTVGCGFEHSRSVLGPSSTDGAASGNTNTPTGPSLVGAWTSNTLATLASPGSCGHFQYQIMSQTTTVIAGTFSGVCGGGITISGTVTGVLSGTSVALTVTGTASIAGVQSCAVSLSGTGTIQDNGYTLVAPFTGTTCLGPVSGTEVLRRPQPAVQVTFDSPTPVSPAPNAFISSLRPTFTVANPPRSGPVGSVSYRIEVASDEAFSSIFETWTVAEQPNQTSFDTPKDLANSKVYYWHVRASDPTTTGPWSRTLALQVQDAPAPSNSGQDAIDLHQATVSGGSPGDVANWPVTARLSVLDFQSSGVAVQFTKKDGPGRWPDVVPPGWDGALQYTLWMVVNVDGHWYTAGGVEYWYGLGRSGGQPSRFTSNWYYSAEVWGPLARHQPSPGEQVGFFVTAGDARAKDVRAVTERSNVVMVPFPSDGGAYYPF